tara:strand:+ start:3212 stop:3349 length:138 start_codon:yes stop_codon:yes gene_type:complete
MRHDLASVFHCSPEELKKMPQHILDHHYAILLARDKKSRMPSPSK